MTSGTGARHLSRHTQFNISYRAKLLQFYNMASTTPDSTIPNSTTPDSITDCSTSSSNDKSPREWTVQQISNLVQSGTARRIEDLENRNHVLAE